MNFSGVVAQQNPERFGVLKLFCSHCALKTPLSAPSNKKARNQEISGFFWSGWSRLRRDDLNKVGMAGLPTVILKWGCCSSKPTTGCHLFVFFVFTA